MILHSAGPDAFLLESLFRNEAWNHLSAPVSEENENAIYRSMIDGCRCACSLGAACRHFSATLSHKSPYCPAQVEVLGLGFRVIDRSKGFACLRLGFPVRRGPPAGMLDVYVHCLAAYTCCCVLGQLRKTDFVTG